MSRTVLCTTFTFSLWLSKFDRLRGLCVTHAKSIRWPNENRLRHIQFHMQTVTFPYLDEMDGNICRHFERFEDCVVAGILANQHHLRQCLFEHGFKQWTEINWICLNSHKNWPNFRITIIVFVPFMHRNYTLSHLWMFSEGAHVASSHLMALAQNSIRQMHVKYTHSMKYCQK